MLSETRIEWRIVCHGSGYPGHANHVFSYQDEKQARQMVGKRSVEWGRQESTKMCSPFHLESRVISDWVEVTDEVDTDTN